MVVWYNNAMAKKQIKSKERVAEHGEVFTNEREVKAMCDLVKEESERIDSRVLEPACGDGNFLAEILTRKLTTASRFYKKNPSDWEKYSIVALSSLYGIDIQEDNAKECRERLYEIWNKAHQNVVGDNAVSGIFDAVKYILKTNIICGDALTLRENNGNPITFAEWSLVAGIMMKRRDFELATMLLMQDNGAQGDFLFGTGNYDEEIGAFIPAPVKEYKPIEYWRVQCLV